MIMRQLTGCIKAVMTDLLLFDALMTTIPVFDNLNRSAKIMPNRIMMIMTCPPLLFNNTCLSEKRT